MLNENIIQNKYEFNVNKLDQRSCIRMFTKINCNKLYF